MEIELRAKVTNPQLLEEKLKSLEGIVEKKSNERQVDTYLKQENDEDRKMIVRIRKNYEKDSAILTFKGKSKNEHDIAWQDYDTPIEDPERLERVLVNNGYVYVCMIDKVRQSFDYKDFEINVDNIRDLGLFVEVEKQGQENDVESIKKEILDLLENLGISESDVITQGYVQLVLSKER